MVQKMADLPRDRLQKTPPFQNVGMDVFGPFFVNNGKTTRANPGKRKVWLLIFTCLYSRAVHLEMLDAMDSATFWMAFRRFRANRGRCSKIRSDRGSNFMGARNQEDIAELDKFIEDAEEKLEAEGIAWEVNPPHASHFGGVWERAIGSIRRVFEATLIQMEPRLLRRDEFETLMQEAAAVVNSTPLWEPSLDAHEPQPISPAMLLQQKEQGPAENIENPTKKDLLEYGATRWKRIRYLADQFGKEWKQHYLMSLHDQRRKWKTPKINLKVGDVVIVKDKNQHRYLWETAQVINVKLSKDGLVRSATIQPTPRKTDNRTCVNPRERPVHDLVLIQSAMERQQLDAEQKEVHQAAKAAKEGASTSS